MTIGVHLVLARLDKANHSKRVESLKMAVLEKPVLPEYLYRYRPLGEDGTLDVLKREVEAISYPYIWCGEFTKLNDPMEGIFRPTYHFAKNTIYERVIEEITTGKTKIGIASLSDTKENELMWTHYARNSTGICIEYRASVLIRALPEDVSMVRIGYDDKPTHIERRDAKDINIAVKKIFAMKKFNWAYEREWRVLGNIGKNLIDNKRALTTIYMGSAYRAITKVNSEARYRPAATYVCVR